MYDRCAWPLNQTISNLVQAPKEVKTWAVARPRTPLETPTGAEWPSERRCTWAGNTGCVSNAWIAGGFSKSHLSKNKETCGYKEAHTYPSCCIKFDYKSTTLSHSFDSPRQPLLSSPCWATWLHSSDLSLIRDNSQGYSLRQKPFYK